MDEETEIINGDVTIGPYTYGYKAQVTFNVKTWHEHHPYGMGTAAEEMSERTVDDVEILDVFNDDNGPETDEVMDAILKSAKDKANEL